MSAFAGENQELNKAEQTCVTVGPLIGGQETTFWTVILLGCCVVTAFLVFLEWFSALPASQEDILKFEQAFRIKLTPEQTTLKFHTKEPSVHQLQESRVEAVLTGLVAKGYRYSQLLKELRAKHRGLLKHANTDDTGIARDLKALTELAISIGQAEAALKKAEADWENGKEIASRCRLYPEGEESFHSAMVHYGLSLESTKLSTAAPMEVGAAV